MKKVFIAGALVLSVAGCANTVDRASQATGGGVTQYRAAVDIVASKKTQAQLDRDQAQCIQVAQVKLQSETGRAGQGVAANATASAIEGALIGAAAGSQNGHTRDKVLIGAGLGIISGLTESIRSTKKVNNVSKDVVDDCLRGRGYVVY